MLVMLYDNPMMSTTPDNMFQRVALDLAGALRAAVVRRFDQRPIGMGNLERADALAT